MCGRTACTLNPTDICNACGYRNRQGRRTRPQWRDGRGGGGGGTDGGSTTGGRQYFTSYNVGPQTYTPVMVSKTALDESSKAVESDTEERVITPMRWGLVPSWHKGSPNKFGYSTINCRDDSLTQKAIYKRPLERGRRCVVLADGFYEWKKTKDGKKQPYFIYFPQDTDWSEQTQEDKNYDEDGNWTGRRVLTMAGIYDVLRPKNEGEEPLYTYTIITVSASPELSWLHDRMPAILESDEAIRDWLDSGTIPASKAVTLIKPTGHVEWHPVSMVVNSVRNKEPECIVPVDLDKPKPESKLMSAWLSKGSKDGPPPAEKPKTSPKKKPTQNLLTSWVRKSPRKQKLAEDTEGSPSPKKIKTS